jgi:hypothetical protein
MAIRLRTEMFTPASPSWNEPADHWKYEYIAEHPIGTFHIQPTCWRIGVPFLVHVMPFSTYTSYDILNILFYTLCGVVIYFWFLAMPFSRDEAILGVLLFYSLGTAVKLVISTVEGPDSASYFFILLAVYAIYKEQDYLCAAALALGMVTKETLLVAIPLHYSLKAATLIDLRRLRRTILVALPAICVLVVIHILIPGWNDRDDYVNSLPFIYTQVHAGEVRYNVQSALAGTIRTYGGMSLINLVRMFTWGSLGIHLVLPFFGPRENLKALWRWSPYTFGVIASLLIAINPERRVGSLFPMLIVMGVIGLRALGARLDASARDFQSILLVQFALLLLKKDVLFVAFDLLAVAFLGGLCWLVFRGQKQTLPVST